MREQIIIADIPRYIVEQDALAERKTDGKWRIVAYETAEISGNLIWAQTENTQEVTLRLNATGKYRIYLGMINMGGETTTGIRLSNDAAKTQFIARGNECWSPIEWFEENYYGLKDLTGQNLIVSKPCRRNTTAALAWVRLVPVDTDEDEEKTETKCMAYHFDCDYYGEDAYKTAEEHLGRLKVLQGGGMELMLHEKLSAFDTLDAIDWENALSERERQTRPYVENRKEVERLLVETAHTIGSKIFASYRMEGGSFVVPHEYVNSLYNDTWYEKHEEYRCQTRDGRWVDVCSYAYPQVRQRTIDMLVQGADGFDGVCLFFHRGTFVAFEKPVRDMVQEKYGVDACKLPITDERLHKTFAHFIGLFLRELRARLDSQYRIRKEINAIVYYDPVSSRNMGYDVESWVNEGLVDSICQGLMMHFEDLTDCLDENGLIDMQKYKTELGKRFVVRRKISGDPTLIKDGAKAFLKICEGKVDFYATLLWENCESEKDICVLADELKALGVKKFLSWNTNHKAKRPYFMNAEKYYVAGSPTLYEERKTRYLRTLSLGGKDISHYSPNWKG